MWKHKPHKLLWSQLLAEDRHSLNLQHFLSDHCGIETKHRHKHSQFFKQPINDRWHFRRIIGDGIGYVLFAPGCLAKVPYHSNCVTAESVLTSTSSTLPFLRVTVVRVKGTFSYFTGNFTSTDSGSKGFSTML